MDFQQFLPDEIRNLSTQQLTERINQAKQTLGSRLVILGHHYQRDEVIQFANVRGDSLKLAQAAASQTQAEYIVFAGVHFMAESADILTSDKQTVCLPNLRAGCSMAEMADAQAVQAALDELGEMTDEKVVPITYVNSTAAVKAVTARADGACCTSGNARNVFAWAFDKDGAAAGKVFAVPDQHLAHNTAVAMGMADDQIVLYDPELPSGGLDAAAVAQAKFILWKGYCYVHQIFRPEDVERARKLDPQAQIIVHPECPREVVKLADAAGSTQQILNALDQAPPNSRWFVGTEGHLVQRLANMHANKTIRLLSDRPAYCSHMFQIDLAHLLATLESIVAGQPINIIRVDKEIARHAGLAVQRMIDIPGTATITPKD